MRVLLNKKKKKRRGDFILLLFTGYYAFECFCFHFFGVCFFLILIISLIFLIFYPFIN